MEQISKRVAFVTGGAGGIGREICTVLAQEGFAVAVGYCGNRDGAQALVRELTAAGHTAMAVFCDVTDYNAICAAKHAIEQRLGFTDTVVNSAGREAYKLFCDETPESIAATVAVDLTGTMNVCRVFSPDMVSNRFGRIVNIASVWGVCGASMETVYSAAKAGVIGFTKALGSELAPSQVTVNAVSPGFIDTPMNKRFSEAERAAITEEIPACRLGTPADVAAAVRFLVREDASYITGQNVAVSGGYKNI